MRVCTSSTTRSSTKKAEVRLFARRVEHPESELATTHEGGQEDLFLRIELTRSGLVRGEAADPRHRDEIILAGWSWGMQAQTAMSAIGAASKATVHELRVRKAVDRSSPVMMSALRNNDPLRRAVLTMRKAGGVQHEYMRFAIEDGRITSYQVKSEAGMAWEDIAFSFRRVEVEYRQQHSDGQLGGTVTFTDQLA